MEGTSRYTPSFQSECPESSQSVSVLAGGEACRAFSIVQLERRSSEPASSYAASNGIINQDLPM